MSSFANIFEYFLQNLNRKKQFQGEEKKQSGDPLKKMEIQFETCSVKLTPKEQ